jgi:hypothetical protein
MFGWNHIIKHTNTKMENFGQHIEVLFCKNVMEDITYKDILQDWCNKNQFYELSMRMSFVPEEILEEIMFEHVDVADKILTKYGF